VRQVLSLDVCWSDAGIRATRPEGQYIYIYIYTRSSAALRAASLLVPGSPPALAGPDELPRSSASVRVDSPPTTDSAKSKSDVSSEKA
jgi:hypothetical protein